MSINKTRIQCSLLCASVLLIFVGSICFWRNIYTELASSWHRATPGMEIFQRWSNTFTTYWQNMCRERVGDRRLYSSSFCCCFMFKILRTMRPIADEKDIGPVTTTATCTDICCIGNAARCSDIAEGPCDIMSIYGTFSDVLLSF